MALTPQIEEVVEEVGTDVGGLRTMVGDIGDLTTVDTSDVVNSINSLKAEVDVLSGGGVVGVLDDLTDVTITSPATNNVLRYSGSAWVNTPFATLLGTNLTALDVASTSYGRGLLNLANAAGLRTEVGAATTTLAALVELSTSAEGIAGTDDARAVTPKVMADTMAANLADVAFSGSASDITTGTLPSSVLPSIAITDTYVVDNTAEMLALDAQRGDVAVVTDDGASYILSSDDPTVEADWIPLPAIGAVVSVAGRQGVVTLSKTDVGLGNVDNTADSAKPISTLTQAALDNKQDEHANLTEVAGLTLVADRLVQTDATGALSLTEVTPDARALLGHEYEDMRDDLSVYSQAQIGDINTDLLALYIAARDA
jgi:hypothetical protein